VHNKWAGGNSPISCFSFERRKQMDLKQTISRIRATIENLESQKRSAIQAGYIQEPIDLKNRCKKNDLYYSLMDELAFNRIILNALEDRQAAIDWAGYLRYLHKWAEVYDNPVYVGWSPVGYDKWLEREVLK
jgi:hypothetical protein